jgi:3-methyladenine DNA glycosylase/8-oxoguanine DNA glycosylase
MPAEPGPAYDQAAAAQRLASSDPELARLIDAVGPPRLVIGKIRTPFEMLLRSIVYQQLSGKAAATIYSRVEALFAPGRPEPQMLLGLDDVLLREAGMSWAKVAGARDLAEKTAAKSLPSLSDLHKMADDEIVTALTRIRGIGPWTVEMLLIFRLGRPDVLPATDLGVRKGVKLTYGLVDVPTPEEVRGRGEAWRPFRSLASWYLWRAVDGVLPE